MKYAVKVILIGMTCTLIACASKSTEVAQTKENGVVEQVDKVKQVEKKPVENALVKEDALKKVEVVVDEKKKDSSFKIQSLKESTSENSPLQVVQNYTEELREVVDVDSNDRKQEKQQQKIATKVRKFFDFEELAQKSLGRNWKKATLAQRKRFSNLFIQLVEKSYLKRSKTLIGNYEITFKDEKQVGAYSKVISTVSREDANIDITYELQKKRSNWMIYNIILDDVNLVRNYQTQFNQIIKKKGFSHLFSLMEKKINAKDDVNI